MVCEAKGSCIPEFYFDLQQSPPFRSVFLCHKLWYHLSGIIVRPIAIEDFFHCLDSNSFEYKEALKDTACSILVLVNLAL